MSPRPRADPSETEGNGSETGRWQKVRGESQLSALNGRIQRVYLEPENVPAYPEAIRAILDADLIVLGPGSLYSSVLPNLLVPDLAKAIISSAASKLYICNVATQPGETSDYDVSAHVRALREHVGMGMFHTVLANHTFSNRRPPGAGADWVRLPRPETVDYRLVTKDLIDYRYPWRHDSTKLAQAVMEFVKT